MANSYVINAGVRFSLNNASIQPVVNSLTKQLSSKGVNIPVNLKFKQANVQSVVQQNNAFRALTRTIANLGNVSSQSSNALNALNNTVKQIGVGLNSFNRSTSSVPKFASQVTTSTKAVNQLSQGLKAANTNAISFAESIGITTRRFSSFSISAAILASTTLALQNATGAALEFDREMVRLKQVSGGVEDGIAGISRTISKLGTDFGVSSKEMAEAAVTLRQAGLSARDTQKALQVLGKTTLSPTFDNLKSTTEGLIALFNQFDNNIDNLEGHFSAISRVSADFAVESSDLVEALKRTGGAFKAAGGNVNELLAMFTTIRSTTRESAESIATGMRTILARLQDPAIARKLHEIGVEVYDLRGQFVGPLEAINRLGDALRKLPQGDIQAGQIIKDIGGLRQLSRVIPLIYNPDLTKDALRSAQGSAGTLDKDAKIAQEALLTQLAKVKEGFLDLFRVISTDSSVRNALSFLIKGVETLTSAMRELKPLVPVFLAFTAFKGGQFAIRGAGQFYRGLTAPVKGYAQGGTIAETMDYAGGGGIHGGIPNKDSVLIKAMPGEFVLNKEASQKIGYNTLNLLNSRSYRHTRRTQKYGFETEHGNFAEHLMNLQLDHRNKLYRTMGDYRFYKSPNYEKQTILGHKSYLRNIITEQKLLQAGITPTPFSLSNAREVLAKSRSSSLDTVAEYANGGIIGYAHGGLVGKDLNMDVLQDLLNKMGLNVNAAQHVKSVTYNPKLRSSGRFNANREIEIGPKGKIATLLHEFGHAVDYKGGKKFYSQDPTHPNNQIARQYLGLPGVQNTSLYGNGGLSNYKPEELPSEGFANAFASYGLNKVLSKKEIQENFPHFAEQQKSPATKKLLNSVARSSTIKGLKQPSISSSGIIPPNGPPVTVAAQAPPPPPNNNARNFLTPSQPYSALKYQGQASNQIFQNRYNRGLVNGTNRQIVNEAENHFNGMSGIPRNTSVNRYRYTYKNANGDDRGILGDKTILANSEKSARSILQSQGKFVTSIKQIDDSLTKRLFPTLSSFISNTTKGANQATGKTGGLLSKIKGKGIGQVGILAGSIAAPLISDQIFGTKEQPGVFGEGGAKVGHVLSQTISGAGIGASIGSTAGPVGTAIGAFAGALVSATGALKEFEEQSKESRVKELGETLSKTRFNPQTGKFAQNDKNQITQAIDKTIQHSIDSQDTYFKRFSTTGTLAFKPDVKKYEALQGISSEEKDILSEAIKNAVMESAKQNPNQDYKTLIDKIGKFKAGNQEYGAGEILGLNFKNVEDVQRFIDQNKKAADTQAKLNDILGQVNKSFELTQQELEDFSNSLRTSSEQYDTRQQYINAASAPLQGQIATSPNNITIGNLGKPGTVAGDINDFSKEGGGYDQARQQLLGIIQDLSKQKLANISPEEIAAGVDTHQGSQAYSAFQSSKAGGKYNQAIAEQAEAVLTQTPNLHETVQNEGAGSIADKILGRFRNIKDAGTQNNGQLQKVYEAEQQRQVDISNRQFEVRQQRSGADIQRGQRLSGQSNRLAALRPDTNYIQGRRVVSQRERSVDQDLFYAQGAFSKSQDRFGASGLNANEISSRYKQEENKLTGLQSQRQDAVSSGKNLKEIEGFDSSIRTAQDNMRNYATALKNLAENTTVLEAAQKKYENAVEQFTADYESRKRDADVYTFGSSKEKNDLSKREGITQQALSLNQADFSALPDQIKKIVYERLNETQGQVRNIQAFDKYGRDRGVRQISGEQALEYFRQPSLNQLTQNSPNQTLRRNAYRANADLTQNENERAKAQAKISDLNEGAIGKQAVLGQANFDQFIKGINDSITRQLEATNVFLAKSAELTKALNSFTGRLTVERSGKIEVILNGGALLTAAKQDMEVEILEQVMGKIRDEIKKEVRNVPAR